LVALQKMLSFTKKKWKITLKMAFCNAKVLSKMSMTATVVSLTLLSLGKVKLLGLLLLLVL
jgi:hypothetical protein